MSVKKYQIKYLIIIIISLFIVYLPGLHAPFVFDDIGSIADNLALKNISNVAGIWQAGPTRFITNLTFALNYHFGGLHVLDYHLLNILIHILAAVTLYFFVLKITKSSRLSFFASLIFALHPIQTQAVTYLVQRSASLATLFYLLCLNFYLHAVYDKKYLPLSLFFAALAFLSKEISFTLPLTILLTDIFFIKRKTNGSKDRLILFSLYFFLLVLTIALQTGLINAPGNSLKVITTTTGQHTSTISRWEYFISQISVIGVYLRLLIFPVNQVFDYDFPKKIPFSDPKTIISLILISLLLGFSFLKKNKYPLLSFAVLFFFTALLVESSVFPIEDLIFEYRLYLPMTGFSIFSAYLLYQFYSNKSCKNISKYLIIALFISLSLLTFKRNFVYRSKISLWQDTANKSPKKHRVRMALADAYYRQGFIDKAISEYEYILTLDPDQKDLAYNNLGLIYLKINDLARAEENFNLAIKENHTLMVPKNNLANFLYSHNQKEEGIKLYQEIIREDPQNKEARRSLGFHYLYSGKTEMGIDEFVKISKLPNASDISWQELADVYRSNSRLEQAISSYQKAINLNTRNETALIGLGKTLLLMGKNTEAQAVFKKVLKINPQNPDTQTGLNLMRDGPLIGLPDGLDIK